MASADHPVLSQTLGERGHRMILESLSLQVEMPRFSKTTKPTVSSAKTSASPMLRYVADQIGAAPESPALLHR